MGDVTPLPRRELFTDERGVGLRVTWHAERDVVVLSLWRDERCTGTFRLPLSDTARLASFLVDHLGAQATQRR